MTPAETTAATLAVIMLTVAAVWWAVESEWRRHRRNTSWRTLPRPVITRHRELAARQTGWGDER